jgi:hypothetical protein
METDSIFLIVTAVGLTPIALSYGLVPGATLTPLFGFPVEGPNLAHIFRAIMGLYLALVGFWISGALLPGLTIPALWSLVIFMLGLAAGRLLSLLLDGRPHWLLSVYLVLELGFGGFGAWLLMSAGT